MYSVTCHCLCISKCTCTDVVQWIYNSTILSKKIMTAKEKKRKMPGYFATRKCTYNLS